MTIQPDPKTRTRAVHVRDSDGTLILCYVTVIDESKQTGRLLWAPNSGPFSEGDLIPSVWLPESSIPIAAVGGA